MKSIPPDVTPNFGYTFHMAAESAVTVAESTNPDLPPRTWRGWWLAWPKWFRIGCLAGFGLIVLHVALAVRIYFGIKEPAEITEMRRRWIDIRYSWQNANYEALCNLSPHFDWIIAGLWGKSWANVVQIEMIGIGTDGEVQTIAAHAVNLKTLILSESEISSGAIGTLASCRKLEVLNLNDTDADDAALEKLRTLSRLSVLKLRGTLVSDKAVEYFCGMKALKGIDLCYTDVTAHALSRWRGLDLGIVPIVSSEAVFEKDIIIGSIRWGDGKRSAGVSGAGTVFSVECRLLHSTDEETWDLYEESSSGSGLGREGMTCVPDQSGEYRLKLRINDYESDPVILSVGDGRTLPRSIEFPMPCTKAEALASANTSENRSENVGP